MRKLLSILAGAGVMILLPYWAQSGFGVQKSLASDSFALAARELPVSAEALSQPASCNLRRNGVNIPGVVCPARIAEDDGCCAPDEGCVKKGKAQGQCFACADEGRDLLCADPREPHGFVCCDSAVQICGSGGTGCAPRPR